jgi:DNA-binding response OmpR family regulator
LPTRDSLTLVLRYRPAGMAHILIVEDEISIADTLVFALQGEGFATHWVRLGREGIQHVEGGTAVLVILDVGLPDMNGFEACKAMRRVSEVPILFLTARAEEIDRVVGLEIGADDYVAADFTREEGALRIDALATGSDLRVSVFNPGEPIPDYALGRVTERFYSLPRPATGRKSTGLGLSFVQEVAHLHDGKLSIRNVEGGVIAELTLPAG